MQAAISWHRIYAKVLIVASGKFWEDWFCSRFFGGLQRRVVGKVCDNQKGLAGLAWKDLGAQIKDLGTQIQDAGAEI